MGAAAGVAARSQCASPLVASSLLARYMEDMANRTTVIIEPEEERALREASRREGVSQSELIRRGIRMVTAPYRRAGLPSVGWLQLSVRERKEIGAEEFGDVDA
jgi:hypothetical protein